MFILSLGLAFLFELYFYKDKVLYLVWPDLDGTLKDLSLILLSVWDV